MTLTQLRTLLAERGLRPLKQLGQNFLIDQNLVEYLVKQKPTHTHLVLEIGPGLGALTEKLLQSHAKVLCMEIDRGLCQYLREVHGTHPNFELIEGDALESIPQQKSLPSMVFGNLPYNISTPLMMAIFLHHGTLPEQITLMLQKEMALRLMALPRTKEYNAVSVITQLLYHVKIIKNVPPSAFYPQPDVDSCIVTLTQKPSSLSSEQRCALYAFVKTAFMHRRKKLSSFTEIQRAERAEELSPDEWRELYESMC